MNKIIQDKIAFAMLEEKFSGVFIKKDGRVFGYFVTSILDKRWIRRRILGVIESYYSLAVEYNEEEGEKFYFEVIEPVLDNISKVNPSLDSNGLETSIDESMIDDELFEITEESMKKYGEYDYMEIPGYAKYLEVINGD